MEQTIIDIIDKLAYRQYKRLPETKRNAYRAMLYAGAQILLNRCTIKEIATEIGYSESGATKFAQKWLQLMQSGDVTVNLIASAIKKKSKDKRYQHKFTPFKESALFSGAKPAKPKTKKVLGFIISPEDEIQGMSAIRSSILFFQKYGRGKKPRLHGQYYTPGTNPDELVKDESKWLPLDTAALYCGCKEEAINAAGQNGIIERRVYKRSANRNYYEYKVVDLDRFIRDNHLL